MKQLLYDLLTAYKLGIKTLYYQNTRDGAEDNQNFNRATENTKEDNCTSGSCTI